MSSQVRADHPAAGFFSDMLFASCLCDPNPTTGSAVHNESQVKVTNEELLGVTALNSWKLVIGRFDQNLAALTDEQLQKQVAPGKNRLFYLVGHLTAVHDRLFPMLGIGERLHPELDETYITNPDRALPDPLSASDLKKAWTEVNGKLVDAFERFTPADWLEKHTAVSDEDFAKDPTRNRLAVVMSRTNHASFHSGQAILAK
jgi:DinB superfamily